MARNPLTVWYFNDWDNDKNLLACSMAAQGMWMRMLGIAAAATPYGHVQIGNSPCSICDLARMTGQDKRSVSKWVRELERKGVFSRTEDGTIFCRRMRREAEARAEARARKRAKGVPDKRKSTPSGRHPLSDDNQADLLNDFEKTHTRTRDSDSDSYAVSQDSTTPVEPLPLPVAAPAREGRSENNEKGNPEGGRCAPLDAKTRMPARWSSRHRDGECDAHTSQAPASDYRGPDRQDQDHGGPISRGRATGNGWPSPSRPPPKSPALKANIRGQLASKHWRYLMARGRPGEAEQYLILIDSKTLTPPQAMFDAVDHRMRAEGWDDMRDWKRQHGIACTRGGSVEHEAKTETLKDLLKRRGGWDRVEGAMQ